MDSTTYLSCKRAGLVLAQAAIFGAGKVAPASDPVYPS